MGAPTVTAYRDWQCLRLYINGLLHFQILMENHDAMQSWLEGSFSSIYCIEFYRKVGDPILLQYDNEDTWKDVLKLLDKHL